MSMHCNQATELLPWLLNGSLDEAERRDLAGHLSACETCRLELEESKLAWDVMNEHVPSLALAEYAVGLTPGGLDRERLERHVELCAACRQELEQARTDVVADLSEVRAARAARPRRTRAVAGRPAWRRPAWRRPAWRRPAWRRPAWRRPAWRRLAVAAGIAAMVSSAAWLSIHNDAGSATPVAELAAPTSPPEDVDPSRASQVVLFQDGFESASTQAWASTHSNVRSASTRHDS